MEVSLCTEITLYMWRTFYLLQTCAVIVFSYVSYDVYFFRKLQIFYKNGFAVWTTPFIAQSQYESVSVFSRAPVYKGCLLCVTYQKPNSTLSKGHQPPACHVPAFYVHILCNLSQSFWNIYHQTQKIKGQVSHIVNILCSRFSVLKWKLSWRLLQSLTLQ